MFPERSNLKYQRTTDMKAIDYIYRYIIFPLLKYIEAVGIKQEKQKLQLQLFYKSSLYQGKTFSTSLEVDSFDLFLN